MFSLGSFVHMTALYVFWGYLIGIMPFNPLSHFEVGFIFPLILRMGKLGVAEKETEPKVCDSRLGSLLIHGEVDRLF